MRTMRSLFFVVLTAALLAVVPSASPVRAEGAVRSGTIVSGTGESPANFWVRGMEGCVGAPSCSAWLQSACNPALAGQDPALHASIVDVADLADNATERVLKVRGVVGLNTGRVIVQFWTGTALDTWDYCGEILASRFQSWADHWDCGRLGCTFRIPRDARWMTITTSPDNTIIEWTLS